MRVAAVMLGTFLATAAAGCARLLVNGPEQASSGLADFEAVWTFADTVYPVLEQKGVDWDSVYAVNRPRVEAAQGEEVFQILCDVVAAVADPHAYIQTEGGAVVYPYAARRLHRDRRAFSPYIVRRYVEGPLHLAGGGKVEYGLVAGNLGYLRLPTFDPPRMLVDFEAVMSALAATDGLIIDVRNNDGGRRTNVTGVVSRFLTAPLPYLRAISKGGIESDVDPPVQPVAGQPAYRRPVVVLINGAAISAADLFAAFMRQVPGVTLVGDTTAGAACQDWDEVPGDLVLPSGRRLHLPTRCALRSDGTLLEWFGMPADVRVTQTEADVRAGRDPQLERAIEILAGPGASATILASSTR